MLSFYYFDFSPLFEFIIFVAILYHFYDYTYVCTLIPCIATLIPTFVAFSLSFSVLPSNSLHSYPYFPHPPNFVPQFSASAFTDFVCNQFVILNNLFWENFKKRPFILVQKRTLPYITTAKPSTPIYCLYHWWRHQWYHQKLLSL